MATTAPTSRPVPLKSRWNVRDHLSAGQIVIQSHRGAGSLVPENTLAAFERGWALGTVPEADLRTTRDGVIVAMHDANFRRVGREVPPNLRDKDVPEMTFDEVSHVDVGSWLAPEYADLRVPRIEEAFERMRGRPDRMMYLDVKNIDLEQLAKMVQSLGVESQVILASTKYDQLRAWKQLAPRSQTLHWMGGTQAALDKRFYDLQSMNYDGVTQLQVHCVMKLPMEEIRRQTVDPFELSDAFLIRVGEEMRGRGIVYQTLPWGGATPEVYFKLLDLGAMSFATDHPRVTLDAIHRYYNLGEGKHA